MLNKIWCYSEKFHMIERGDRIVVGISGGADSVCLLYVLKKLCTEKDISLIAVHINHGIRGEEADRDELFVKEFCERLGVEFYPYFYDVRGLAAKEGISEEEAGRNVRYQTFLEVCKHQKCNKIAVAHNKNDNAETVLFHLFRGSGIKGMSGIEPRRNITADFGEVTLIRPLLCAERKEIEAYLRKERLTFQTDSTNLTEDYSRNKIRNRILSYAVSEINSGAVGNINETSLKLREAFEYMEFLVSQRYQVLVRQEAEEFLLSVRELCLEPVILQKGILQKVLEKLAGNRKDLEAKHIDAIISLIGKQVGRRVHLPYGMIAERGYEDIKIFRETANQKPETGKEMLEPVKVTIPGRTFIPQYRKILESDIIKYEKNDQIPKSSCMKWFDYDKIENAVEIRNREEGDYIQINNSGGRKKLKDYFIDHKIPRKQRDSQILIADGNHIMWIPGDGERMSEKYKVDDTTVKVLLMKMIDLEEYE
ncbi:MAG TPA: tRNA lysidine(34) synthetase TilS [Mobilitalea sp.]|nr:tRNA lysidine(34) synthetase TilS [Mobilitalea sp.]